MKKLLIIAIAFFTLQVNAQERGERKSERPDFTPEEMAQLQTKKMILDLDLTDAQQKEVSKINLEIAHVKKEKMETFKNMKKESKGEKPSKEEMFKMKNEMLDAQIANKKKMKEILNEEQFQKWEKMQSKKDFKRREMKKMKREHGEHGQHKQHRERED